MSRSGTIADPNDLRRGRDRFRPQTRDEMRIAVHELASRGWTDYGIAQATELSVEQVRRLLGERAA